MGYSGMLFARGFSLGHGRIHALTCDEINLTDAAVLPRTLATPSDPPISDLSFLSLIFLLPYPRSDGHLAMVT